MKLKTKLIGFGWKKWFSVFNLLALVMGTSAGMFNFGVVNAASAGVVVINEVAWAGSVNSANDEWVELYNPGLSAVDLSGWKLRYNGSDLAAFASGASIAGQGYFLVERSEASTSVASDAVITMTLANTGASLELVDESGNSIDLVNSGKAAWFAGSATTRATMERKDATVSGDLVSNWASSTGTGATASLGGAIIGTPKAVNSVSAVPVNASQVKIYLTSTSPMVGEIVKATVQVENVTNLFAYGLEINYDPAVLKFQNVVSSGFLSDAGAVSTAFNSGLKGDVEGDLLIAEARTIDPKIGRSGSGELLQIEFEVIGAVGSSSALNFVTAGSFAADPAQDLSVVWSGNNLTVKDNTILPVTGLQTAQGVDRYQIKLNWTAPVSNPEHYRIERKNAHGEWMVLAGVTGTEFVDQDGVLSGGKIIPEVTYFYRVSAVKGDLVSSPVEISGSDLRGIKGDNNRSDLVDGRDLERLARAFTLTDVQAGFDGLIDTTYDGRIDGSDLIDVGANFARQY